MCATLLPCPLCTQPRFNSLESLRIGLIKVATENLTCPVCKDNFIGLDKLTIHLFSHCDDIYKNVETTGQLNKHVIPACKEAHDDTKNKKKLPKNTSPDFENSSSNQSSPVFNMNSLPFIGIPKNIDSTANKTENNKSKKILSEKCDICGYYFIGKNILHAHKRLIHNMNENENRIATKYPCHLCSKVFKMRGSLMVHLRMVHLDTNLSTDSNKKICSVDNANLENKVVDEEKQVKKITENKNEHETNNNKQWQCDICQKMFTTKYFLKKHKRLHTGEMPYSCKQCNKTFTFQQSYHKHLLYHNDDKPYTCSHCGRSFKELSTLHNHQRIHTGEKPFSCESCGKCFRQRVSYLVHRRIHTGVMPYKCTACDKSFRYKVSQRTHKCTVQPPGTVIRQSGELVQKLMKNQNDDGKPSTSIDVNLSMDQLDNVIDKKTNDYEDGKNIIDELIKDSIKKFNFDAIDNGSTDFRHPSVDLYSMVKDEVENAVVSPSDKFKNLKLTQQYDNDGNNSTKITEIFNSSIRIQNIESDFEFHE